MIPSSATVFIVDDDPAVRDALGLMIEQGGFAVQTFESAEVFLDRCDAVACGCAIVDIRMPGMDGMQLQSEMTRRGILLPVIFLTGHGDIPMSVRAIKAGAADFLTKPVTRDKLMASIHAAVQAASQMRRTRELLNELTGREREVMLLAVAGHPNKEIARQLGISHRTVEIHKARIMHKTGALNLLDLAHIAQEGGLSPA